MNIEAVTSIALLFLAVSVADEAKSPGPHENLETLHELTASQKKIIVDRHNEIRAEVDPTASNMLKISWDEGLATIAKKHASTCLTTHAPASERKTEQFKIAGENIFGRWHNKKLDIDVLVLKAVNTWNKEKKYYKYETSSPRCQKCLHYSAVIWATTNKVGCGVATCKNMPFGKKKVIYNYKQVVVCNYGPMGNLPQHPYLKGSPRSACPEGKTCV